MAAPKSWDDIQPGKIITYTRSTWSRRRTRYEYRESQLQVTGVPCEWSPFFGQTPDPEARFVEGVHLTKAEQPDRTLNRLRSGQVLRLTQIVNVRKEAEEG